MAGAEGPSAMICSTCTRRSPDSEPMAWLSLRFSSNVISRPGPGGSACPCASTCGRGRGGVGLVRHAAGHAAARQPTQRVQEHRLYHRSSIDQTSTQKHPSSQHPPCASAPAAPHSPPAACPAGSCSPAPAAAPGAGAQRGAGQGEAGGVSRATTWRAVGYASTICCMPASRWSHSLAARCPLPAPAPPPAASTHPVPQRAV